MPRHIVLTHNGWRPGGSLATALFEHHALDHCHVNPEIGQAKIIYSENKCLYAVCFP
jgi:hypothetical protein